ncbi:DUF2894 domain-containing protein [Curvibacter sp. HBC61]|uniref:DUF2894 domain-containing protein n=1 Tax=Curvibacter cyanobacteriorum TaxID=3026422 RepID=A0ABT5MWB7_9BURK|nr:DUF2894 domain-containing protein [Curvibacter sp. HBC61]MDD0837591.1 DUF2894 domain-containing protein [Curvibacter sp. HBC61]
MTVPETAPVTVPPTLTTPAWPSSEPEPSAGGVDAPSPSEARVPTERTEPTSLASPDGEPTSAAPRPPTGTGPDGTPAPEMPDTPAPAATPAPAEARPGARGADAALLALAALQARGADRLQPLPFKALQLLAERLACVPAHRAQGLQARLEQGLQALHTALNEREAEARRRIDALAPQAPEAAGELARRLAAHDWAGLRRAAGGAPPPPPQPGVLAELTAYLEQASARVPTEGEVRLRGGVPELKSAARFRPGWTRLRAEQRVRQALTQAPDQAGPFNSQMLLLRSLELLRKLSPAYLEHLVAQVDSLLWLEQAQIKAPRSSKAPKTPTKATGKAPAAAVKTPRRKAS